VSDPLDMDVQPGDDVAVSIYLGEMTRMDCGCAIQGPFCRGCFPWGQEDEELTAHYRSLLRLRKRNHVFRAGGFRVLSAEAGKICYERFGGGKCVRVTVDRNSAAFRIESVNGDKLHPLYTGGKKKKKEEHLHV